jgi:ABC-type glycerol-3-phosphate transport system substrate-binding protein
MSVLWQGAVRNSEVRIIPKTFDEFITSCAQLRKAGFNYPVVIGASSEAGAVVFLYHADFFLKCEFYGEKTS